MRSESAKCQARTALLRAQYARLLPASLHRADTLSARIAFAILYKLIVNLLPFALNHFQQRHSERPVDASKPRKQAVGAKSGALPPGLAIPEKPMEPWMPINPGHEVKISEWPDDYLCTGVFYTFTKALARPIKPRGEWNTLDITLDGPHTIVYLNAVKVTDFTEGQTVPPKSLGLMILIEGHNRTQASLAFRIIRGSDYFKECR